ncbi:MAG: hypothetical protein LBR82_02090 [Desulfovibrio sp.]|jgi:hypothetical protein|nr:hypothetical protein [Desulfovibrio sp.]
MKRHGNLFEKIVSLENLELAYRQARRGKPRLRGVINFEKDRQENIQKLHDDLVNNTLRTGRYTEKIVHEPKTRTIFTLPFRDRIVHHALMNVIEPIWQSMMIEQSYACIVGRGIHSGSRKTMEYIRRNTYCLKCDVSKFYPTVDHEILLAIIRRKIKCERTLNLLSEIVYSFKGNKDIPPGKNVPIGNYTSQWFGNLYLNELDQYVRHELKFKDYIRYCDDFLLFGNDKVRMNTAAANIKAFMGDKLKQRLSKCDLFPVSRGVDFLGYRHFRTHILLRKRTAKRWQKRLLALPSDVMSGKATREHARSVVASAQGWLKWANSYNFRRKVKLDMLLHEYIHKEKEKGNDAVPDEVPNEQPTAESLPEAQPKKEPKYLFKGRPQKRINAEQRANAKRFVEFAENAPLEGEKYRLRDVLHKPILILNFRIKASKFADKSGDLVIIQFEFADKPDVVNILFSGSTVLRDMLLEYQDQIPFYTTITPVKKYLVFS